MKIQPDTDFPIDQTIREKIFQIPLLPQDQIMGRFEEIDNLLYPQVLLLTEKVPRLRKFFQEVIFRIASGNTFGKNYFDKEDHEDDPKSKKKILKNSETRILKTSFALLRLFDNPKKFSNLSKDCGFLRGIYEDAMELFLSISKDYPELVSKLNTARQNYSIEYIELENKVLAVEEELGVHDRQALINLIRDADRIWKSYSLKRENLVAPYFRMVYTIAKKFSTSPAQTLDNFQNGTFGLFRAVKCYTPSRFAAFSVVAKIWIRQAILLNLKSEVNFIRLPVASWHSYQRLEKIKKGIEQKEGKDANFDQIAKAAKMSLDKVQKVYENAKLVQVLSLNQPTSSEDEQSGSAKWNLESIQAEDTTEAFELKSEFRLIEEVVSTFDEEEKLIFGLISGCFDLIPNPNLDELSILKEGIKQKAAKRGFSITYKV